MYKSAFEVFFSILKWIVIAPGFIECEAIRAEDLVYLASLRTVET